ncbi:DUF1320 domain-containing protein [Candidatus Poribacteria bacterium]|nr:DUF1320 domain-containing protein [Candidatus Poribacteria bacterium]
MAYSTVEDVQRLFANIAFDATTPVTDADITGLHIPLADATIDGRLRGFYDLPLAGAGDLELLRLVSMNLAAGSVAEVLYETTSQPNVQSGARRHRELGELLLDGIADGSLSLEAERKAVADAGVSSAPRMTMDREF